MSRVCEITKRGTQVGNKKSRRGLAKKHGGVGKKLTGITKRKFKVNVKSRRLWVPQLGRYVRLKVSARGLRTISKTWDG